MSFVDIDDDQGGIVIPPETPPEKQPKPEGEQAEQQKPEKVVVQKQPKVQPDDEWATKLDDLAAEAKKAQDAERQRTQEAEQRAQELRGKLSGEVEARFKAEEQVAAQGLAGCTSEIATYKAAIKSAYEEGNADQIADLTDKLADAKIKLNGYQNYDRQLKQARTQLEEQAKQEKADPLNQYPQSVRDWVKTRPTVMTDAQEARRAQYFGEQAELEKGLTRYSPEYFKYINAKLDGRDPDEGAGSGYDDDEPQVQQRQQRQPEPRQQRARVEDIPVTRRTVGGNQRNDGKVHLTQDEKDAADIVMGNNVTEEQRIANYRAYAARRDKERGQGIESGDMRVKR